MVVLVEVVVDGADRPPVGAPVRVEVRDTSQADTEAPLLAETTTAVEGEHTHWLQTVELVLPDEEVDPRARLTVFAHVDVDEDDAISAGDFITMRSYPLPAAEPGGHARVQVAVQRV